MRAFLLLLALAAPAWSNTLTLEFAQEGEPRQARALILIHGTFEDREAFENVLTQWGDRDYGWARSQYCSVYTYEYEGAGLRTLLSYETLAKDLLQRIERDKFEQGDPDSINPARRCFPQVGMQPLPTLRRDNVQLLLGGTGYGGLVAREVARLAKERGREVTRVAYVGTPLDGLSTVDLVLSMTSPERHAFVGLEQPLSESQFDELSPAWWSLVELYDESRDWQALYAPVYAASVNMAAYGAQTTTALPTDNVLYGRNRALKNDGQASDGFLPQPVAWGKTTGHVAWASETTLPKTPHKDLTETQTDLVLKNLVDTEITYEYLARRQGIEEYVRGPDLLMPALYIYFDERDRGTVPMWRNAYASRKGLYEMMWGVSP